MTEKNKNRIYGKKADIDENSTKQFWNSRADKYDESNPYVSVKLGDKQPEKAQQWDNYEKENLLPLLNISSSDNVLDIGCGIGRLADIIIPKCGYYLGVDYAAGLIELAKKRVSFPGCNYAFLPMALQEVSRSNPILPIPAEGYTVIIIAGTMPFLNDETICLGINNIMTVMSASCRLYIPNTVATGKRLTLDNFDSEELGASYSIIYRTAEEYISLYEPLFNGGFELSKYGEIPVDTANTGETQRIYHILTR